MQLQRESLSQHVQTVTSKSFHRMKLRVGNITNFVMKMTIYLLLKSGVIGDSKNVIATQNMRRSFMQARHTKASQ